MGQNQQEFRNQPLTLMDAYKVLSRRECEILQRLAEGKSNQQISSELYISPKTLENHMTRMGKKLKCGGRNGLRKWLKHQINGL